MSQPAVNLRCSLNRSYLKTNTPGILFLALDLNSKVSGQGAPRSALNVGLAIDCSGSMQEHNKFRYAQEAAISLVKSLRSTDTISITSFETKARVEVPSTHAQDTVALERTIDAIPMGKETDLYEGLRLAWQQIAPNARPGVVSRVIVLTDGEPTHGKTKEKDFLKLAEEIRESGVSVTTIGVGPKYNESLLTAISQSTGSLWYHVSEPSYMKDIFAQEVTKMSRTIVQNPTLEITAHEGIEIIDVYTMKPMVTKLPLPNTYPNFRFRIKDIVEGEDQTLFLRVKAPPRPAGKYPLLRIQLGQQSSEIEINFTDDEKLANTESDPYPRLLWVAGDGLTQVQRWLDGETKAKIEAETRIRTLISDNNLPTVVRQKPTLETAVTLLRESHDEATKVAPGRLAEDDKKRLKQQTTVLRKAG